MAVADVFRVRVDIELPDTQCSLNLHYQELNPTDSGKVATEALADALQAAWVGTELPAILCDSAFVTGIKVYKLGQPAVVPSYQTVNVPGVRTGDPLPANNGLRIGILQAFFPSSSNGMIWIPGISETDSVGNTFENLFMLGDVAALTIALGSAIAETPQVGLWRLVVLSRKFLLANPGDYAGAAADAVGATANPIVGSQRVRTTKRRGAPGA